MTWVDWAIIAVAAAFALAGWRTGLIAMLVWAASVVAGVAIAGAWHGRVLVDLAFLEEPPTGWLRVAAFAVLFGAVMLAGAFAAHWARGAAKTLMLGWADGAGGAVVGLAFALLAMQALAAAVVLAPVPEARELLADSRAGGLMLDAAPAVQALLPAEFDTAISEFAATVRERAETLADGALR